MDPLLGINLKLDRADEHLAAIQDERRRCLESAGGSLVGKFDSQSSDYIFRVPGRPPRLRTGILVGEFALALRSSLDNLFYALVEARLKTPLSGDLEKAAQFPIAEDPGQYPGEPKACLAKILSDDRAFIEGSQPYKDGLHWAKRHPLALLAHLDNINKHRFIHVSYTSMLLHGPMMADCPPARVRLRVLPMSGGIGSLFSSPGNGTVMARGFSVPQGNTDVGRVFSWMYNSGVAHNDRTEVFRARIEAVGPNPQMYMQTAPTIDISLSDSETPMILSDLIEIRTAVQKIVDHFTPVISP